MLLFDIAALTFLMEYRFQVVELLVYQGVFQQIFKYVLFILIEI
jgi:hypothetical protein